VTKELYVIKQLRLHRKTETYKLRGNVKMFDSQMELKVCFKAERHEAGAVGSINNKLKKKQLISRSE